MDKWEYHIIVLDNNRRDDIERFDMLGRDGWELVTVDANWAFFKRKLTAD